MMESTLWNVKCNWKDRPTVLLALFAKNENVKKNNNKVDMIIFVKFFRLRVVWQRIGGQELCEMVWVSYYLQAPVVLP